MKKRLLSCLLALVMLFSCLPIVALAEEAATAYTPAEGDVIYIPGVPAKEGKISKVNYDKITHENAMNTFGL